jgi:hypothetical protein
MTQYLFILILFVTIITLFVYYKYFNYTIINTVQSEIINTSNEQNQTTTQTQPIQPTQPTIPIQTSTQIQTNITNGQEKSDNYVQNILDYLEHEKKNEDEKKHIIAKPFDNLLNKYIMLNNTDVNMDLLNDITFNKQKYSNQNQYIDLLMNDNGLNIEIPQKSNIDCEMANLLSNIEPNIKFNLIDRYIQANISHDDITNIPIVENFTSNNKKIRTIWVYWENFNRDKYPTYIKLCMKLMNGYLGSKYQLIFLNEKTIRKYLTNLREDFQNLKIAQKVDYYRIALLNKFGGVWIDADIIIMSDIKPIFDKLDEGYDYVGFGCTGYECSYGYSKPSNWVMASQPNGLLMNKCLEKLNKKLDNRDKKYNTLTSDLTYHDYGKIIIWESLDELAKSPIKYNYYHFSSEYDGTRDNLNHWIHFPNFFSTTPTTFLNESKLLFVVLYNSEIISGSTQAYELMYNSDESTLLDGNLWIQSLFRKSLKNIKFTN